MDFQEIVVKDSPGLCRCCLSEGCYKELGAEYTWLNETEVYADMLLDCFDVSISQHVEGPNGPNRLICEVCIMRLRDACEFKKQVLESEKKFVDMVGKGEFSKTVLAYKEPVKVEINTGASEMAAEYLDEDLDLDNDDLPESIEIETPLDDQLIVSMLPVKAKRGRPKKTVTKLEKSESKTAKLEEKPRTSKGNKLAWRKLRKQKYDKLITDGIKRNLAKILRYSTIMPFRWYYSRYRCFFCSELFDHPDDLKSHQEAHLADDLRKGLDSFSETEVYVDVRNITCKSCSAVLSDVNSLFDHLNAKHRVRCTEEKIKSFKLDNTFTCLLCDVKFESFGSLIIHTSTEHDKECHSCMTEYRIDCKHKTEVKCKFCNELFVSDSLKIHIKEKHNEEATPVHKCLYCSETFTSAHKRTVHLVRIHKHREDYKCPHCNVSFVMACYLRRHIRRRHNKERNWVCEICAWSCFDKTDLLVHYAHLHSNDKNFKCLYCDKSFATKGNLRQHSKRCAKMKE